MKYSKKNLFFYTKNQFQQIIYFIFFSAFIFSVSCKDKNKQAKAFQFGIIAEISNNKIPFCVGDTIVFNIHSSDTSSFLSLIKIYMDGKHILTTNDKLPFTYKLHTDSLNVGKHYLNFITYNPIDKKNYEYTQPVELLSDIIPYDHLFKIINVYPHDANSFTEGLEFYNGFLYEGTGLTGQSKLRKLDLKTGKVLRNIDLDANLFGEGITILNEKVFQLTWQTKIGFVYELETLDSIGKFYYETEGWGLTNDGNKLIMSDGTCNLYFYDSNFSKMGKIEVYDNNGPVNNLNELQYVKGLIYANVWQTDTIVQIDPENGKVVGILNLKGILNESIFTKKAGVLNGIAYNADNDLLLVTGKNWEKLFAIKIGKRVEEK